MNTLRGSLPEGIATSTEGVGPGDTGTRGVMSRRQHISGSLRQLGCMAVYLMV